MSENPKETPWTAPETPEFDLAERRRGWLERCRDKFSTNFEKQNIEADVEIDVAKGTLKITVNGEVGWEVRGSHAEIAEEMLQIANESLQELDIGRVDVKAKETKINSFTIGFRT